MRLFARCPTDSALPDRTTIMNFRHLLEQHPAGPSIVPEPSIAGWPSAGVMVTQGTLVDAAIIWGAALPEQRQQGGDASDQERQSVALWQRPTVVSMPKLA